MIMKFDTSENILNWNATLIQVSNEFQILAFVKMKQFEKMSPIESELNAIQRVDQLRRINEDLGVFKPDSYYCYMKLAILEMNDKGYCRTEEHLVKDVNNEVIKICLN